MQKHEISLKLEHTKYHFIINNMNKNFHYYIFQS